MVGQEDNYPQADHTAVDAAVNQALQAQTAAAALEWVVVKPGMITTVDKKFTITCDLTIPKAFISFYGVTLIGNNLTLNVAKSVVEEYRRDLLAMGFEI